MPKKNALTLDSKEELTRNEALEAIENAERYQASLWRSFEHTVDLAVEQVTQMRIDSLEDRIAKDSGLPLWLSAILAVAFSIVPIEALVAAGTLKLVTYSRNILGRVGLDKEAKLIIQTMRDWDKDLGLPKGASDDLIRGLMKIDVGTTRAVNHLNKHLGKPFIDVAKKASETGAKSLISPSSSNNRFDNSSGTDHPVVTIKAALFDWIEATRLVEEYALNALKKKVRDDDKLDLKETQEMIAALSETKAPDYNGPDARLLLQRHIEECIWCSTYDFSPTRELQEVPEMVDFHGVKITVMKRKMVWVPLNLGEKFWKTMTNRYIDDFKTGKTFAKAGTINRMGSEEKPFFTNESYTPEVRLSWYLSYILWPKLRDANRTMADEVLATFSQSKSKGMFDWMKSANPTLPQSK